MIAAAVAVSFLAGFVVLWVGDARRRLDAAAEFHAPPRHGPARLRCLMCELDPCDAGPHLTSVAGLDADHRSDA